MVIVPRFSTLLTIIWLVAVCTTRNVLSFETCAFGSHSSFKGKPHTAWSRKALENRHKQYDPRICFHLRNKMDDEEEPTDDASASTTPTTPLKEENDTTLVKKILLQMNLGFAYITIAVGVLLTAGLVLNLFGFGYQITPEGELRIDTITQLREEAQFRREVYKSMQEYRQEQRALLEKSAVTD